MASVSKALIVAVSLSVAGATQGAIAGPAQRANEGEAGTTEAKLQNLLNTIEQQSTKLEQQQQDLERQRADLEKQRAELLALKQSLDANAPSQAAGPRACQAIPRSDRPHAVWLHPAAPNGTAQRRPRPASARRAVTDRPAGVTCATKHAGSGLP